MAAKNSQNILRMFSVFLVRIKVYLLENGGPLLLFAIIALAIYWAPGFFGKGFFNWGDTHFPFAPKQAIKCYYYLWDYYSGTGASVAWTPLLLYNVLIIIFRQIGLPLWLVNRLVFLIPLILVAWSTYFLAGSMIRGRYAKLACTFAGLFAILNPVTMLSDVRWAFSMAGVPLTLGLFIRILRDKDNRIKYSLLLPIASLLLPLGDPIFVALPAIVAIVYLVLHLVMEGGFRDRSLWGSLTIAFLLTLLVNMYCILPFLVLFKQHILPAASSRPGQGWGLLTSVGLPWAGLPWIIRLITQCPNQMLKYFSIPVILLISFLLPAYVYLPLLKTKKNKSILNLAIIGLILTLFATTVRYRWFGIVYKWLWDHIYFFPIFRNPRNFQYMLSFVYAVLLGFALQMSLQINRRGLKIILVAGLSSVLFVYGSFTLGLFGPEYNASATHQPTTVIPDSYYNLREYLLKDADWQDRLYVLPWMAWATKYKWSIPSHDMIDVVLGFSPIPVIGVQNYGPRHQVENQVINSLAEGKVRKVTEALSKLSVKYIFLHKDISEESFHMVTRHLPLLPKYERLLSENTELFRKVLSTKEYDLYEFISPMRYPMIFAVDNSSVKYNADTKYYVFDRQPADKLIESSFKMVNLATYTGKLKIDSDCVLIFNQDFNSNWHLFINGKKVGEHIRINEFANGWFIRGKGDLEIRLKYQPQMVVLPGIILSLGTICLVLSGVGYLHFMKNRKPDRR